MIDIVKIARARVTGEQRTHWEGCERDHTECLIQRMAGEIERLRAENTVLRQCRIDNRRHIDKLSQECDALRADAERYWWLRDPSNAYNDAWNYFGPYSTCEEIDAAIDAERKEEGK